MYSTCHSTQTPKDDAKPHAVGRKESEKLHPQKIGYNLQNLKVLVEEDIANSAAETQEVCEKNDEKDPLSDRGRSIADLQELVRLSWERIEHVAKCEAVADTEPSSTEKECERVLREEHGEFAEALQDKRNSEKESISDY